MNQIDGPIEGQNIPDRWLRVFIAAGSAGSFTGAARSLGVGQSAVSHAVSRLERALGVTLFERSRGGARLTAAGTDLLDTCTAGFAVVDRGVEQVRFSEMSRSTLTVSVSTSLATYWLMPRLARFKQRHPSVNLRCVTSDTDTAIGRDGADLWIPLGRGPWDGFESIDFCDEVLYPVASPGLLSAAALTAEGLASDPRQILELPVLHLEERYNRRFDWWQWFRHVEVDVPKRIPGVISNDYSLILQAALDGQGVALGWHHIVGSLVDQGRLVRLAAEAATTADPFVILTRGQPSPESGAQALRRWLVEEMR